MKKQTFEIPIWRRWVTLVVGGDVNFILNVAKERKLSEQVFREITFDNIHFNDCGACYFCMKEGEGIIWFPAKGKISWGIYAHEFTHFVDFLSNYVGMETEMEARAYTVEWLIDNVPQMVNKLRK